jgi:hypothetical protein
LKFKFIARCGEESLPLEVSLDYRPGKQTQRARRLAVGELLAWLEIDEANIDATSGEFVRVETAGRIWVIGEGGGVPEGRGVV